MLDPWVPSAWYPDPANPGKTRYYNAFSRSWVGKPRGDQTAEEIPLQLSDDELSLTPRSDQELSRNDQSPRPIAVVDDCLVLGGHGLSLPHGIAVGLLFGLEAVTVRAPAAQRNLEPTIVPYAEVLAIAIGGLGTETRDGGFHRDGVGLRGPLERSLVATALNLLTTQTETGTVICLRTTSAELFLHHGIDSPDTLRIRLSQVFKILRARQASPQQTARDRGDPSGADGNGDHSAPDRNRDHVVDRLAKLADLLERGLLTPEEFSSLKARLLSESGS